MRVQVRFHDVRFSNHLDGYIRWRLSSALGFYEGLVDRVTVRVGRKRRGEVACRLSVRLLSGGQLEAEACNAEILEAIDVAVDRMVAAADRSADRVVTMRPPRSLAVA